LTTPRTAAEGRRRTGLFLIATAAALLAVAGPSYGATVVGQTFTPTDTFQFGYTTVQSAAPGSQYTVPTAGVLTSWSFQASATEVPQGLKLKVARPAGGNSFSVVGDSAPKNPVAATLNTYTDVSIPVQPGDILGLFTGSADNVRVYADTAPGDGYFESEKEADVAPGPPIPFDGPFDEYKLDISATLEGDCDGDGFGDETEDPLVAGGTCAPTGRVLSLDANKNLVKKGKRVRFSGRLDAPGDLTTCESGQTVELELKKGGFSPVGSAETDADGDFSTKLKVRQPATYRATIVAQGPCGASVSDTEKVKLKK
jgi:hypothetical protein